VPEKSWLRQERAPTVPEKSWHRHHTVPGIKKHEKKKEREKKGEERKEREKERERERERRKYIVVTEVYINNYTSTLTRESRPSI
jgi:hypothetical protein